jgi:cobalt-zinc-cadmium efflux system outer membrane protein
MTPIWKRAALHGLLAQALCMNAATARAQELTADALPSQASVLQVLAQSPAYQAAVRTVEAEQSVQQQYRVGTQEWTASVNAAQRQQKSPTSERTSEWELGLDRGVRLPGKARAYEQAGQSRVDLAQATLRKVWREQGRLLLERHVAWLREREAAAVWARQVAVLEQQLTAVSRRHGLGDAARIEQQQAQAVLAQAQAQAQAATGRTLAAKASLDRQFPGLAWPDSAPTAPLISVSEPGESWVQAQIDHSPELEVASLEAATAQAQMQIDSAEARPDPTVGVRFGRARSGAETVVGMVLSMPIGGSYRAAGAQAAASRASAAALLQADVARRTDAEAAQRLQEAQTAQAVSSRQMQAAIRLSQVADAMARGYQLGEGSLSEVLNARRQANEQQLAASMALVEASQLLHRLALEAGTLWAPP